jgi:hypothetical protein
MSPRMRYRLEVIGAAVTGLAVAITAIVPDWIEEVGMAGAPRPHLKLNYE